MKTQIKYNVRDLMVFNSWEKAVSFAKKCDITTIVAIGKRGGKTYENAYSVDTWKTAKNIKNEIEAELF
jgi:hypothetical protein